MLPAGSAIDARVRQKLVDEGSELDSRQATVLDAVLDEGVEQAVTVAQVLAGHGVVEVVPDAPATEDRPLLEVVIVHLIEEPRAHVRSDLRLGLPIDL